MSFEVQEQVLLSLLFDRALREAFARDREAALAGFELSKDERADFRAVRLTGLELDATLRRDLVLARLCRSLPLSFSIASAFDRSLAIADGLLTAAFFAVPGVERTFRYAERLRSAVLAQETLLNPLRPLVAAVLDLELGMAGLGAAARRAAIGVEPVEAPSSVDLPPRWEAASAMLAPHTGVFVLPRSYAELSRELCPCTPDALWARLGQAPLPRRRLEEALTEDRPRLLVVRARVERASRCEATVSQRTVELADGFLTVLQKIATGTPVQFVLEALHRAGASPSVREGVLTGLRELFEQNLLCLR